MSRWDSRRAKRRANWLPAPYFAPLLRWQAPAFFKRASVYYAVFGACCCYCEPGSSVHAYTATSPLGPYTDQGPIDAPESAGVGSCPADAGGRAVSLRTAGPSSSGGGGACPRGRPAQAAAAGTPIRAQQTDLFQYFDSHGTPAFAWIGDHWQSAPDHVKAHDFTVWAPVAFDAAGHIQTMYLLSNFTIDVGPPPA
jgi:hypothetical protein